MSPVQAQSRRLVRHRPGDGGSLGEGGFTIVEVMMASVILVVGFIGMISAITVGSEMMATARRQALATQIITHECEKLRLLTWANMPAAGTTAVTIDSLFTGDIAAAGVPFTLSRTTTDVISNELKEVTFTITWSKTGTTAAATTATGSWLERLSFAGNAPVARTYTRTATVYYGRYGVNNSLQRL